MHGKVGGDGAVSVHASSAIQRHGSLLHRIEYRLVTSEADKEKIFDLRYRAYLQEGAIEPRADHQLRDRFDDLPNSWTFGVYLDGALASSLRVSVESGRLRWLVSSAWVTF